MATARPTVNTVRGDIDVADPGATLTHVHVFPLGAESQDDYGPSPDTFDHTAASPLECWALLDG